jgi:hypothetical protein
MVTKQWLIDSIILGKREDEKLYLPPNLDHVNNSCTIQPILLEKRSSKAVYGTLFKNISFSVISDSYSPDEIGDITEKIELNGGSVISEYIENSTSKYIIMNDGYHQWKGFNLNKNEQGKYVVSHRFLDR